MISSHLRPEAALPSDHEDAILVGRINIPGTGPTLVQVRADGVHDLSRLAPTCSELLELPDPAAVVRAHDGPRIASAQEVLANSSCDARVEDTPFLLAPCDLQAIKAAGVTFVASMLERVIEEQARGDASKAESARQAVIAVIGDNLGAVKPGSPEATRLKDVLIAQGMWSQYLEVGIGPDAEIFTKSQPMSAVGTGCRGRHPSAERVEQPRAGDRAGRQQPRPGDGRRARQRREPARLRGPQRAAAGQGQGQQRELRHRAVHPPVRRELRHRRRARAASSRCGWKARTAS